MYTYNTPNMDRSRIEHMHEVVYMVYTTSCMHTTQARPSPASCKVELDEIKRGLAALDFDTLMEKTSLFTF